MGKILKIFWVVIILGTVFLAYTYFKPDSAIETPVEHKIPTPSKTSLQEEVKKEVEEEKTQSDFIVEGDDYNNKGYYKEAIIAYQKALNQNPDSIQALYKLGLTYFKNSQLIEARQYFEQLKELQKSTQIDILIGRTYINKEDMQKAFPYFDQLPPDNKEVKYYKAILKILQKKHEEATTDLTALSELSDNKLKEKVNIFLTTYQAISINKGAKPQHVEALLAKAFIDAEEYSASIPLLFDVISMQNNYRDAWIMLGYAYLQTGKTEDALDALLQAKILDPKKPETLFFIGITYAVQEKYDDAINALEQAKEAGFEPATLVEQKLADLNLIKKEYDKSLQSYSNIINSGVADLNLYTKAIWICIEKVDKTHKAIQLAEKAMEQYPSEAISFSLRGWAFVANGDYDKAKEDLVTALEMDPRLDHAYLNMGWMYEKQNFIDIAKEYYKKAYLLGNGNSIANLAALRFNNILKADISSPYSP